MNFLYRFSIFVVGTFLTTPVYADGCKIAHRSYSAPVYHNAHHQTYQHHDYQAHAVFAVPFVQIPATFFQVAPEIAQAKINQVTAEEAAKKAVAEAELRWQEERRIMKTYIDSLQEQEKLRQAVTQPTTAPNYVVDNPDPLASLPLPGQVPIQNAPRASLGKTDIQPVANAYCTKCHGAKDPVNLTQMNLIPIERREKIVACVERDPGAIAMPPKGDKIPPDALMKFRRWMTGN